VMLKDLRLISRDRFGLVALLVVPIVVIMVIAAATQSGAVLPPPLSCRASLASVTLHKSRRPSNSSQILLSGRSYKR
jgi:hypothetical protein